MTVELVEGLHDEMYKCAILVGVNCFPRELSGLSVEVDVAPETLSKTGDVERP